MTGISLLVGVRRVLLLVGLVIAGLVSAGTTPAAAAGACGASGVFSQSGSTATCTYSSQGTEDTFTVPGSVSSVSVTAVGGAGGSFPISAGGAGAGGLGAKVMNTALPVTAGATLYVDVGQSAAAAPAGFACLTGGKFDGGSNNLGPSSCGGAAGGGSSAVLTAPRASATLTGNPANDPRLLVAGAGGGTGGIALGGNAGAAVTGAGAGGEGLGAGGPGGVGPTDGSNGGGAGATCSPPGTNGTAVSGGNGDGDSSGGGGGGWFGGGGGCAEGGGGGGSSYGGHGPSGGITITTAPGDANGMQTQAPEVVITFTSAGALVATLVSDSTGKGPGHALADKATAIRAAVSAGQTATACADITDYLGLVKAQTGKHLTRAQANELTTDATNLATALDC